MLVFFLFRLFESGLFPAHAVFQEEFNPAHLAYRHFEVSSFGQERFGLAEFRTLELSLAIRSGAVALNTFGNENYRENQLAFGFGGAVNGRLAAGAEVDILNCWIREQANRFSYRLKFGGLGQAGPFTIASWLNNVNRPRFNETDRLPLSYGLDFRFAASERFSPCFSILGAEGTRPFFKFGFDLTLAAPVRLTGGINSDPVQVEYGIRFRFRAYNFVYAGSTHQQLGLTHGLGFQFAAP